MSRSLALENRTEPGGKGTIAPDGVALAVILVIGTAVRLRYLSEPMRGDESFTYNEYARRSFDEAISLYTFPNNHLLYTGLVHLAVSRFGAEPWAIRLPAL